MHSTERYEFTVVTHRDQNFFNVIVMSFRNFSVYVQKQITKVFRFCTNTKSYIDDIVILFKTLKNHLLHLNEIFDILKINNISIKLIKSFIESFSVFFFQTTCKFFRFCHRRTKVKSNIYFDFFENFRTVENISKFNELISWIYRKLRRKNQIIAKKKNSTIEKWFSVWTSTKIVYL